MFDRALVRQGETIHMKHIVRMPVATGFAMTPAFKGPLRLSHRGPDTQFELPLTIDANGTGETDWSAPKSAPMGAYDLPVDTADKTSWTGQSVRVAEYRLPMKRATIAGARLARAEARRAGTEDD